MKFWSLALRSYYSFLEELFFSKFNSQCVCYTAFVRSSIFDGRLYGIFVGCRSSSQTNSCANHHVFKFMCGPCLLSASFVVFVECILGMCKFCLFFILSSMCRFSFCNHWLILIEKTMQIVPDDLGIATAGSR